MRQFGIILRMVPNIKQKCEELISRASDNAISLNTKTIRSVSFSKIDHEVLQFLSLERMEELPVSQALLVNRALVTRKKLLIFPTLRNRDGEKQSDSLH